MSNVRPMNYTSSRIYRWLLSVLLVCLTTFAWSQSSDAELRQRLVGHWQEVRLVECERHQQQMHLNEDGTFEANGTIEACGKTTFFVWRGSWYIKAGKFGYTTTYTNAPDQFKVGESFEDQIVSVSDREWVMVEQSTGNKSFATKIK
jgi:hypothetical protein